MPEEIVKSIEEGLYVATIGMGLVFFSLLMFLLVLVVIRRVFPDDDHTGDMPTTPTEAKLAPTEALLEKIYIDPPKESITGEKVAAMAVAIYLQMENLEKVQMTEPVLSEVGHIGLIESSNWKLKGRNTFMNNQGQRPSTFRQRGRSNHQQRRGF